VLLSFDVLHPIALTLPINDSLYGEETDEFEETHYGLGRHFDTLTAQQKLDMLKVHTLRASQAPPPKSLLALTRLI
jgi:hypothetical protein